MSKLSRLRSLLLRFADEQKRTLGKPVPDEETFQLGEFGDDDPETPPPPQPEPQQKTLAQSPAVAKPKTDDEFMQFHFNQLRRGLSDGNYADVSAAAKTLAKTNPSGRHLRDFHDWYLGRILMRLMQNSGWIGIRPEAMTKRYAAQREAHKHLNNALNSLRETFRIPDDYFEGTTQKFARLRSQLESKSLMDAVSHSRNSWYNGDNSLYPSDPLIAAANHYSRTGDPRGRILQYHADAVEGFKSDDPHFVHNNSVDRYSVHGGDLLLPDGSSLHVHSHGHTGKPGVHTVSFHWTPPGGDSEYSSYHHPDEARAIADEFGEADPAVGQQIHDILNGGEDRIDRSQPPQKFSAYKAPAGGMIVGNTFYPGGSLVPDLTKQQFAADSKPKRKKKKRKLNLNWKRLRDVIGSNGNSCQGEGSANGG